MSNESKTFRLGDVLSFTDGRLLSRDHMDGVYRMAHWVLDDPGITTIGLLSAAEPVKAHLCSLFPELVGIEIPEVNSDNYDRIMTNLESIFGDSFEVTQAPDGWHTRSLVDDLNDFADRKARDY